jgi:hypothetical protein
MSRSPLPASTCRQSVNGMTTRLNGWVIALAVCGLGCAPPPTQVVVRLATELDAPSELDRVTLEILDEEGNVVREQSLVEGLDALGPERFHTIGTFGIIPRGADATRRFEVRATAQLGGRALFSTRARSSFIGQRTLRLDVYIPRLCLLIAETCREDQTCGIPGCVDPEVDPETLPSPADPTDSVDPRGGVAGPTDAPRLRHPWNGFATGSFAGEATARGPWSPLRRELVRA